MIDLHTHRFHLPSNQFSTRAHAPEDLLHDGVLDLSHRRFVRVLVSSLSLCGLV
jgi:hypothetical protein